MEHSKMSTRTMFTTPKAKPAAIKDFEWELKKYQGQRNINLLETCHAWASTSVAASGSSGIMITRNHVQAFEMCGHRAHHLHSSWQLWIPFGQLTSPWDAKVLTKIPRKIAAVQGASFTSEAFKHRRGAFSAMFAKWNEEAQWRNQWRNSRYVSTFEILNLAWNTSGPPWVEDRT